LDLKFQDEEDNFNTGEARPFLIYKSDAKRVYLCPITSQKKKRSFVWQYLISSPKNFTCLSSKKYPYSYAVLNRKIILKLKRIKSFSFEKFCWKGCLNCLPPLKFSGFVYLRIRYWRNPYNWISTNKSKVKEIKITI